MVSYFGYGFFFSHFSFSLSFCSALTSFVYDVGVLAILSLPFLSTLWVFLLFFGFYRLLELFGAGTENRLVVGDIDRASEKANAADVASIADAGRIILKRDIGIKSIYRKSVMSSIRIIEAD